MADSVCRHKLRLTPAMWRGEVLQVACLGCGWTHDVEAPAQTVRLSLFAESAEARERWGLSETEGRLYAVLARPPRAWVSREQILTMVWGEESRDNAELLHTNMARIRTKLRRHNAGLEILNMPRTGYRLVQTPALQRAA